jgi:protein ImuA
MFLFCSNIFPGTYSEYPGPALPQTADPSAFVVARNRTAVMEELRRLLPGIAHGHKSQPFGLAALDSCLPEGGLSCAALHEIVPAAHAMPAAFGFLMAILARLTSAPPPSGPRLHPPNRGRVFLVLPSYGGPSGRLYGRGLHALGLDPAHLVLVETQHRKDTLWAVEEAVRSGAPAAVAGFVDRLDLKTSQRLQLFATEARLPLFVIRPPSLPSPAREGGWGGGSAAATRWRVGTAEAARDRFGLIVRPRWHLQLERARNGRPGEWVVEYDHVAHRFSLAAALADPARAGSAGEDTDRKAHCA